VGRRQLIALTVAGAIVVGSGLTVLGLTLLPQAPSNTGAAPTVPADEPRLSAAGPLTPGGVGDGKTTVPSAEATPETTGSARGGSSVARFAGLIEPGTTYHGVATFYAADGGGNCMFDPGETVMVAAMNHVDYEGSMACGAYVRVTGPRGNSVTVQITDQCPECEKGALDLSRQAFAKLSPASAGKIPITWKLLSPSMSDPIQLRYKSGSSRYWCAIQVMNHRNPVARVEFKVSGSWTAIPRQDYNYFLSASGAGCGGQVRVTDIYGQRITVSGLSLSPNLVQDGPAQFTRR
jgi:expansin